MRNIVENEILTKMSINSILNTFYDKDSQKNSIKIALKDVIQKQVHLNKDLLNMFKDLLNRLNFWV